MGVSAREVRTELGGQYAEAAASSCFSGRHGGVATDAYLRGSEGRRRSPRKQGMRRYGSKGRTPPPRSVAAKDKLGHGYPPCAHDSERHSTNLAVCIARCSRSCKHTHTYRYVSLLEQLESHEHVTGRCGSVACVSTFLSGCAASLPSVAWTGPTPVCRIVLTYAA